MNKKIYDQENDDFEEDYSGQNMDSDYFEVFDNEDDEVLDLLDSFLQRTK